MRAGPEARDTFPAPMVLLVFFRRLAAMVAPAVPVLMPSPMEPMAGSEVLAEMLAHLAMAELADVAVQVPLPQRPDTPVAPVVRVAKVVLPQQVLVVLVVSAGLEARATTVRMIQVNQVRTVATVASVVPAVRLPLGLLVSEASVERADTVVRALMGSTACKAVMAVMAAMAAQVESVRVAIRADKAVLAVMEAMRDSGAPVATVATEIPSRTTAGTEATEALVVTREREGLLESPVTVVPTASLDQQPRPVATAAPAVRAGARPGRMSAMVARAEMVGTSAMAEPVARVVTAHRE